MPSNTFAENLLALFTTREGAASIVGDLLEQSHSRARGCFACEVLRLAFALCFDALISAPGRALRLAGLGLAVFVAVYLVVFIASGLPWYPWHRMGTVDFWVRVGMVAFVANLATGAILGRRRSKGNVGALGPLVAVWLVAWLIQSLFVWGVFPMAFERAEVDASLAGDARVDAPALPLLVPRSFAARRRHRSATNRVRSRT